VEDPAPDRADRRALRRVHDRRWCTRRREAEVVVVGAEQIDAYDPATPSISVLPGSPAMTITGPAIAGDRLYGHPAG